MWDSILPEARCTPSYIKEMEGQIRRLGDAAAFEYTAVDPVTSGLAVDDDAPSRPNEVVDKEADRVSDNKVDRVTIEIDGPGNKMTKTQPRSRRWEASRQRVGRKWDTDARQSIAQRTDDTRRSLTAHRWGTRPTSSTRPTRPRTIFLGCTVALWVGGLSSESAAKALALVLLEAISDVAKAAAYAASKIDVGHVRFNFRLLTLVALVLVGGASWGALLFAIRINCLIGEDIGRVLG
jgi:hypothetical protein